MKEMRGDGEKMQSGRTKQRHAQREENFPLLLLLLLLSVYLVCKPVGPNWQSQTATTTVS